MFTTETRSHFRSQSELRHVLRASCHIPLFGGILPYPVPEVGPRGQRRAYYDGLFWPSVLHMWRKFDRADTLHKVSGIGNPWSNIAPPLPMPLHWVLLPPSKRALWQLFACGYHDAQRYVYERLGNEAKAQQTERKEHV